jgi:NADPH:quinone reductase-like Zn-dependent oxidoreductase
VDVVVASGTMLLRRPEPPFVLGLEGVARREDGVLVQFFQPPAPFGAYAGRVPLAGTETHELPAGLDAESAAALGVSGLAAWAGLAVTGGLHDGDRVLVLGAAGQVGRIAVQAARRLGAAQVVGVVADPAEVEPVVALGADAALVSSDLLGLADALRAHAPVGFDLVLDTLWGPVVPAVLPALATGARVVQVGNSAGALASIPAPLFRNRDIRFLPHSNFLLTEQERATTHQSLFAATAAGDLQVPSDVRDLADLPVLWDDMVAGRLRRKLLVRP